MPDSPLQPLVSELGRLINDGDVEDAFERLKNYLRDNSPKLYDELLSQAGRFHTQHRRYLAGMTTLRAVQC